MNEAGGFTCEINIFCRTPDGFDAHIKSTEVDSAETVGALLALSRHLAEEGFTYKGGGSNFTATVPEPDMPFEEEQKPRPWSTPAKPAAGIPVCAYCGGAVWDNRKNKKSPKGPDFKCKDKDNCGAAAWVRDGELSWAPPEQG